MLGKSPKIALRVHQPTRHNGSATARLFLAAALILLSSASAISQHNATLSEGLDRTTPLKGDRAPGLSALNSFPDGLPLTNRVSPARLIIFETQRYLESQGISPGCLDGVSGPQTKAALAAYQRKCGGLALASPDRTGMELARGSGPPFVNYCVGSNDFQRLQPLGKTWLEKSQQTRLEFETISELLAETFHCSQQFLRLLNPGLEWDRLRPGLTVTVPNLLPVQAPAKAALVRIAIGEKHLEAFDSNGHLLVHFPCSIARRVEKRPLGNLEVVKLASDPNYLFDPENFPESEEARRLGRKLILPPGPNNPVGAAWIGLNRPGYGIHGTPWPEEIGRTESHGCFRLANWNAVLLVKLVAIGTPVLVEP